MTQHQYISYDILCEYIADIKTITHIAESIGNVERIYAASSDHTITYRYASTDPEAISMLHRMWELYLAGEY